MSTAVQALTCPPRQTDSSLSAQFATDVIAGLLNPLGKVLSPRYLYDDLGSALFDAITLLPEYGLTRADQRLLERYSPDIARVCGPLARVAELGSGSGKKTVQILRNVSKQPHFHYAPIDVSAAALNTCEREIGDLCSVNPVCSDWLDGLGSIASDRPTSGPMLLLFLGSSIGNLERAELPAFLGAIRSRLRSGDFFLLGADLEKDVASMLRAYDDPTGVTAAFNLNLLGRINRELNADFDLSCFRHEARWNSIDRRIEMHLTSLRDQVITIGVADARFHFAAGESIWTESSHKFQTRELRLLAQTSGFTTVAEWTDQEWPLAEVLWRVT